MKEKNTKWNLIWIIPEIIGSIAIGVSAALHIRNVQPHTVIGLMEWTFQMGLIIIVLGFGFKMLGHACEELKKALRKKSQRSKNE